MKHRPKLHELEPLNLRGFVPAQPQSITNKDDTVPLYIGSDRNNPIGTARIEVKDGRVCVVGTIER